MKTHDIVRGNVEHWLQKNKKSCQWLDDKIGVSQTMIQQTMLEREEIPSEYIEKLSKIMNVPVQDIVKRDTQESNLIVKISGQLDNCYSKQGLKDMLLDIEDYMSLRY